MRIEDSIMLARDLDIFFMHDFDGEIRSIHCATFGALLPEELNDDEYIGNCTRRVSILPMFIPEDDIVIENNNVNQILGANIPEGLLTNEERINSYIRTFVNMARKGFWSYDRYHEPHSEPGVEDNRFLLIAHPKRSDILFGKLKLCNDITLVDNYINLSM